MWVVPGARTTAIVGLHDGAIRVRVAASPERGRANRAAAELLADVTGARAVLVSGASSRRKRILIEGATSSVVASAIATAIDRSG